MEIGVLNGDNAVTMVEIAMQDDGEGVEYYGFDFFRGYRLQEVERKLRRTGCKFKLFKGDSAIVLPKVVKTLPEMDLIFIDGGKSYSVAESDWEHSRMVMHGGTAVFIHNSDFSGVRRMVENISRDEYSVELIRVPFEGETTLVKKRTL
jgi:predicted O-methyltransferase YrrM